LSIVNIEGFFLKRFRKVLEAAARYTAILGILNVWLNTQLF